MKIWILLFLVQFLLPQAGQAQGIWGRLRQKAELIGERVIDKKANDILRPREPKRSREMPNEQPEEDIRSAGRSFPAAEKAPEVPAASSEPPSDNSVMIKTDTIINGADTVYRFHTQSVKPKDFVAYALTLKGTKYVYGSTDPLYGLDCSGFITHVFNHFNISVPRRTVDFNNAEKKVALNQAQPGDIILFTGYDHTDRKPGHMGIVTRRGKDIEFVHASSGKANAVTSSVLSNAYFKQRFLALVRVF